MPDEVKINALDKPDVLLRAVEHIIADPADIQREAQQLLVKFENRYGSIKSQEAIRDLTAKKVISNYSYFASFVGGATGLTGVVPGLGSVIASFGGTTADIALSMKFQIEMTMALATIYGRDIKNEEARSLCLIIAGFGAINKAATRSCGSMSRTVPPRFRATRRTRCALSKSQSKRRSMPWWR